MAAELHGCGVAGSRAQPAVPAHAVPAHAVPAPRSRNCGTIIGMRPSEWLWAQSELSAGGSSAAGDRTRADCPAGDLDGSEADRGLAGRLARLPAAHPSARSDAVRSDAVRSDAGWGPGARDSASEDAWWRGESDIWWRITDGPAGEPDYDDIGGLGDPGELADADYAPDAGGPGGPDDVDGEADGAGEADDRGGDTGGRPARRTEGPAGRDPGARDVRWGEAVGARAVPNHGSYRPWFSPDASGDPWFAAGLD